MKRWALVLCCESAATLFSKPILTYICDGYHMLPLLHHTNPSQVSWNVRYAASMHQEEKLHYSITQYNID